MLMALDPSCLDLLKKYDYYLRDLCRILLTTCFTPRREIIFNPLLIFANTFL